MHEGLWLERPSCTLHINCYINNNSGMRWPVEIQTRDNPWQAKSLSLRSLFFHPTSILILTFICAEVQVLVSACFTQEVFMRACACVRACVHACLSVCLSVITSLYSWDYLCVRWCSIWVLWVHFFFNCLVGCFSMTGHPLFWVSYMHVFCIFVFAPVQHNWACFTWKGALEICSLLLLLLLLLYKSLSLLQVSPYCTSHLLLCQSRCSKS